MAEPAPLLALEGVAVAFGGVQALDGLDLTVRPEEIVGVIGPNGAGKTTALNVASGLVRADAGTVRLDGEDLRRVSATDRARRGMGRTFQTPHLFPGMTLLENLEVTARQRRRAADATDPAHALRITGLSDQAAHDVQHLAAGQRRFAEIARALVLAPRILLLDEPGTGLREREIDDLAAIVRQLRTQSGIASVIISHDMRLVHDACDRVVVVDEGRTLAEGTPEEISRNEAVVRAYFGDEVPT